MTTRGVLYIVWGDEIEPLLQRSIASVKKWHPDLPTHIHRAPTDSDLRIKSQMYKLSPFDVTLYLDCDTVVMGDLSYGFTKAEHGIACCICEAPWARRHQNIDGHRDGIEYNTGVIFFDRNTGRHPMECWESLAKIQDSSIRFIHRGLPNHPVKTQPCNDQGSFAAAIAGTGFNPFVLPLNWNLRPEWHRVIYGPVKVWHDRREPFTHVVTHTEQQNRPGSIIDLCQVW